MNVKDVIITMSPRLGQRKNIESSTRFELTDLDSGFRPMESRNTGFRIFLLVALGF